ncbi:MAG: transglutaminase domain-containing protein [Roseburia sp.]|nr:transglutaminase domain-containing protein [Roseburia sp.]MCM1241805.1 transglutaminase domain-containing protein [Roseburia sp.]
MRKDILNHYLQTGAYTYAGAYKDYFRSLPEDISELGRLICSQVIHRVTLREGNTNANAKLQYGDMERFPWYRMRCEDDMFMTAAAMSAELFRLDERGFTLERATEDKIVVTCRYVSVLMSAILKSKGVPCRSRAGFAPYFQPDISMDHWINQYYYEKEDRWVTIDADGFYDENGMGLGQYDIAAGKFDYAGKTWLDIREGKVNGERFLYADGLGTCSLKAVIRALFYDFHALMNDEISYLFQPCYIDGKFEQLTEEDFKKLDELAYLLEEPDENFDKLTEIWRTEKKFRIMNSPLVGDYDNMGRFS